MPPKIIRLIVALALALAVPVQAMSAVMAGICAAAEHHSPQAEHVHDGDAHSGHDHDEGGKVSDGHCPPCVAAAAISGSTYSFTPELPAASPIGAAPYLAAGFQPDGLDRPPLAL